MKSSDLSERPEAIGTLTDLNTLPGLNVSEATAINDSGVVVGYSANFFGYPNPLQNVSAFLMNGGHLYDLPGMAEAHGINSWDLTVGFTGSALGAIYPNSINDNGDVVGQLYEVSGGHAGVLYNGQSSLQDLNTIVADPTWSLQNATGINNSGQICGSGLHNGLQFRGFLITPVFHPYFLAQPAKAISGK